MLLIRRLLVAVVCGVGLFELRFRFNILYVSHCIYECRFDHTVYFGRSVVATDALAAYMASALSVIVIVAISAFVAQVIVPGQKRVP